MTHTNLSQRRSSEAPQLNQQAVKRHRWLVARCWSAAQLAVLAEEGKSEFNEQRRRLAEGAPLSSSDGESIHSGATCCFCRYALKTSQYSLFIVSHRKWLSSFLAERKTLRTHSDRAVRTRRRDRLKTTNHKNESLVLTAEVLIMLTQTFSFIFYSRKLWLLFASILILFSLL